jgi:hypothetical protein
LENSHLENKNQFRAYGEEYSAMFNDVISKLDALLNQYKDEKPSPSRPLHAEFLKLAHEIIAVDYDVRNSKLIRQLAEVSVEDVEFNSLSVHSDGFYTTSLIYLAIQNLVLKWPEEDYLSAKRLSDIDYEQLALQLEAERVSRLRNGYLIPPESLLHILNYKE